MVTAIFASARHLPGIAVGDAIGANVTMLTVVLGLAALVRPLELSGRVRTYALAASAAGVAAALCLLGGRVGRVWGGVLVTAYLVTVGVAGAAATGLRRGRRARRARRTEAFA
jgi:cation:H+ antiporter